jgi:long-chain acyl-CoA synthetase
MERVELLAFVEQRLGGRVDAERRAAIFTVRQLVDAVELARTSGSDADDALGVDDPPASGDEWHRILADPGDPTLTSGLARHTGIRGAVIGLLLRALLGCARAGMRVRVSGLEHLPARGPYLICPNHQSHLDGFVLAASVPLGILRQLFLVGASEYFDTPARARGARLFNIVPVDADANLVSAMRAAAAGLRLGRILLLFPEGERSIDGRVKAFRKGAAILGLELAVPVVPVAIDGLYDVWPRGRGMQWSRLRPWRRANVTLIVGEPLRIDAGDPADGAMMLQTRVEALLGANGPRPR